MGSNCPSAAAASGEGRYCVLQRTSSPVATIHQPYAEMATTTRKTSSQ